MLNIEKIIELENSTGEVRKRFLNYGNNPQGIDALVGLNLILIEKLEAISNILKDIKINKEKEENIITEKKEESVVAKEVISKPKK